MSAKEIQKTIDAVNHANKTLARTLLVLQKAFDAEPNTDSIPYDIFNDLMGDIF